MFNKRIKQTERMLAALRGKLIGAIWLP